MMTTMLGFCCAFAGPMTSASPKANASILKQILLTYLIIYSFLEFSFQFYQASSNLFPAL